MSFSAIGAFSSVVLGYFDRERKEYEGRERDGPTGQTLSGILFVLHTGIAGALRI